MDPEDKHLEYLKEWAATNVKNAVNMARVRFTVFHNRTTALDFKVYMQIWQDDEWDYNYFHDYCKKLVETKVELNTTSYKAISDQLYQLIAMDSPGSEIWIKINSGDIGLTTKYQK